MEIWRLTLQAQLTLNDEKAGKLLSDARHFNAVADRLLGDAGDEGAVGVGSLRIIVGARRKETKKSLIEAATTSFAPRPTVSNGTSFS
jgi:hypothetical protein